MHIRAIICDSLAKSFVTCTKSHNALFGCGKCFCKGKRYNFKTVFLKENARKRIDDDFRNNLNNNHHTAISPLVSLPIDMIKTFPLDYMHLICAGVTKKLVQL